MALWDTLPAPRRTGAEYVPAWKSVALFFNLEEGRPPDYATTASRDVENWLDRGDDQAISPVSTFLGNYWGTLSYGRFALGIDSPRDGRDTPLIPTLSPPAAGAASNPGIVALMQSCIRANADACWRTAGSLRSPTGNRWIPSIVLVHRYNFPAWAWGGFNIAAGGETYEVGRVTHLPYDLTWDTSAGAAPMRGRVWWLTLCHEFGHNFLEFGDLYGPDGCTGYWDLLGCHQRIGKMSEVSSVHKQRIGWSTWSADLAGPNIRQRTHSLRPFTTAGDAMRITPDPANNPYESFVLEYRRSTGSETWRPDGGLEESGLLITHMDTRFRAPRSWLLHDAPYYDPELANGGDRGGALWQGWHETTGTLFQQGAVFDTTTSPSSALYGPRASGLRIEVLDVLPDELTVSVELSCSSMVGWRAGESDRLLPGRFTTRDPAQAGRDILARSGSRAALLEHRQAQWFVRWSAISTIDDGFALGPDDRELVADLDGDGLDEVFVRRSDEAVVLKWTERGMRAISSSHLRVGDWALGPDNWEVAADVDGDGRDEVVVRSPGWIGVLSFDAGTLSSRSTQQGSVGRLTLAPEQSLARGRFTRLDRDQILVHAPDALALLEVDGGGFRDVDVVRVGTGRWTFSADERWHVGDYDGDGLDEVFIHTGRRACVLKWVDGALSSLWGADGAIGHHVPDWNGVPITDGDRFVKARMGAARDGLYHLSAEGCALLAWENGGLAVRRANNTPQDPVAAWRPNPRDRIAVGDFHRLGLEFARPSPVEFIADMVDDLFVETARDTLMVSFANPVASGTAPSDDQDQLRICWWAPRHLLFRETPDVILREILEANIPLDSGLLIGNLADGGYLIIYPSGRIKPVPPWDGPFLEQVQSHLQDLAGALAVTEKLQLRKLVGDHLETNALDKAIETMSDHPDHDEVVVASKTITEAAARLDELGLGAHVRHTGSLPAEGLVFKG